jgi:hypothetical protein
MAITIRQATSGDQAVYDQQPGINPTWLVDPWWVRAELGNGKWLYTLQGIVVVNWRTNASDMKWNYETVQLDLFLQDRPAFQKLPLGNNDEAHWQECEFDCEHFSANIHLSSIANDQAAISAGWCVDSVNFPRWPHSKNGYISVTARIGGRDVDGWIYRLGYSVNLYGQGKWTEYRTSFIN